MVKRIAWAALFFGVTLSHASQIRQVNLEQLLAAGRIFLGTAVSERFERGAGGRPPVVITTFEVEEAYRGNVGKKIEVRQVRTPLLDLPQYRLGEKIVLFLGDSGPSGFTSPVAGGQGVFHLRAGKVMNQTGNRGLLGGIRSTSALGKTAAAKNPRELTLQDLKDLIRSHTKDAR